MAALGTNTDLPSVTTLTADAGDSSPEIELPRVKGVLVVGAPESGIRHIGAWLHSSGYFPVESAESFQIADSVDEQTRLPTAVSIPWTQLLLSEAHGSWEMPPVADVSMQARSEVVHSINLRLQDAIDCAHGSPIVLADERILPLLPALGRNSYSQLAGLLVLRNPLAIARTLSAKTDVSVTEGIWLWEHYMAAGFSTSDHLSMLVVDPAGRQNPEEFVVQMVNRHMRPSEFPDRPDTALELSKTLRVPTSGFPAELDWLDATEDEFRSIATSHQLEMWDFLVESAGRGRLLQDFPDSFTRPSEIATEALRDGSRHRRDRVSTEQLDRAVNEERAAHEILERAIVELQELLASATQSLQHLEAERDQLIETTTDLMQRLRTMGLTQAEGHRKADRLSKEVKELHVRLLELLADSEELERVYKSEIWRAGRFVTLPLRRLKDAVVGKPSRI